MWYLILICLAFLIFTLYNIITLILFGIPNSLSNTFYLYNSLKKNLGYVFTGMMFIIPMLLLPAWLEVTEIVSLWSHYLTVFPFFGTAGIIFVGAAPTFKSSKMEDNVHTISAIVAAVFSLLWCFIVCYKIWYVVITVALLAFLISYITKTNKTSLIYWLEIIAFESAFISIFIESLILMKI